MVIKLSADSSRGKKTPDEAEDAGALVGEISRVRTFFVIFTIETSWYPKLAANNDTHQGWPSRESSVK